MSSARPELSEASLAASFQRLSPTCQREYLAWLTMAKRPEMRTRRLAETLATRRGNQQWAQRKAA